MNVSSQRSKRNIRGILISLAIFLLALFPRAYDLGRFVTADEAKWVYRSARFLNGFLQGDFAATSVNLTPAVTTTWLGSTGLLVYYQLNQSAIDLPFPEWLNTLPEFRAELPLLVATRWPMVILTSLGVVAIYWLTRFLFNPPVAFIAAILIALDPHLVALSRILGHDAPTAMFSTLSLLLLLLAMNPARKQGGNKTGRGFGVTTWVILSGVMAGLSFLSKAPALFLVPFSGLLVVVKMWQKRDDAVFWATRLLLWGVAAYLAFLIVWPAAWLDPVGRPPAVVENAFLSATDQVESDAESYWRVPNLGPIYYLVNGAFKLSPLVLVGVVPAIVFLFWPGNRTALHVSSPDSANYKFVNMQVIWLLLFVILFVVFMTLGGKRSPRYILPIFPPLAIVAAVGWHRLYQIASSKVTGSKGEGEQGIGGQRGTPNTQHPTLAYLSNSGPRIAFYAIFVVAAALILWPYAPYYFTYFNPLLGGSITAPHLMKIGWGEGLDRTGRFLQRELGGSRVGTAYASTVAPFYSGDLSSVTGDHLDYLVLYSKQVQSGQPSPAFIRYFEQGGSLFTVNLNGIRYADVYPGPALVSVPGQENTGTTRPVAFRPLTPYGHIGAPLNVDVVWQPGPKPRPSSATVTLQPLSSADAEPPPERIVLAGGEGELVPLGDGLRVSHHQLMLPADLSRGNYTLFVDDFLLGQVELRHFQAPSNLGNVDGVVFNEQIGISGYQFEPAEDYLRVIIAWQSKQPYLPDYTVFAQLLDVETNQRVAGFDTQPVRGQWPTSRWVTGEVVTDEYLIAVPPDLPAGQYNIIVGLYRPETRQRLTLANGKDHWLLPWTFIWDENRK